MDSALFNAISATPLPEHTQEPMSNASKMLLNYGHDVVTGTIARKGLEDMVSNPQDTATNFLGGAGIISGGKLSRLWDSSKWEAFIKDEYRLIKDGKLPLNYIQDPSKYPAADELFNKHWPYFRGPDSTPHMEINSKDLIEHYPRINDFELKWQGKPETGSFNPSTKEISIGPESSNPRQIFEHEANHFTDWMEGRDFGDSPLSHLRNEFKDTLNQIVDRRNTIENTSLFKDAISFMKEDGYINKNLDTNTAKDALYEAFKNPNEYSDTIRKELIKNPAVVEWLRTHHQQDIFDKKFRAAHADYMKNMGEGKARTSEARLNLSDEERANRPVYKDSDMVWSDFIQKSRK